MPIWMLLKTRTLPATLNNIKHYSINQQLITNMKYFNRLSYILAFAAIGLFASCEQDNEGVVYNLDTMGVTFLSASQSVSFPANGYEGFDVELVRAKYSEAATVSIDAYMKDSKGNKLAIPAEYTIPSSASFAAGENKTTFHVSVGNIKSGVTFKLYFDLGTDNANVDAKTVKTVSVYRDYTFSKIGTGSINSEAFGDSWAVEWEKADDITWYRAIAPYEEGYDVVFKVGTDGKTVTVAKQAVMSDLSGYGTTYVAGAGELVDGVITVKLELTVSAGSFGQFKEVFYLPN